MSPLLPGPHPEWNDLLQKRDALHSQIASVIADIHSRLLTTLASRRRAWPFDQLPILDDSAATAARQAELDTRIATAESVRDERKLWLNQILGH